MEVSAPSGLTDCEQYWTRFGQGDLDRRHVGSQEVDEVLRKGLNKNPRGSRKKTAGKRRLAMRGEGQVCMSQRGNEHVARK